MANAMSDYLEDALLGWFKGTAFPTAPATVYIGLFTALPGDTGSSGTSADGTEATGAVPGGGRKYVLC